MTNQHHEHHVEYSTHPMQCLGSNSWENPTHISPGFRLTVSAIARGSDDAEIWTKQWPSFSEYHGGENQTAMDNNNVSWKSCIKYTYITTIYISRDSIEQTFLLNAFFVYVSGLPSFLLMVEHFFKNRAENCDYWNLYQNIHAIT
jgi:hypothetical protein